MHKLRVIPVLLLRQWGLEKSIRFGDPVYVGSPINAARVFNGRNVDELIFLDIVATHQGRGPMLEILSQIAAEAFMPITAGGGVRDVETVRALLQAGADRVVINTAAVERPELIRSAADRFGSQCMVVSIDARRRDDGSYEVFTRGGRMPTGLDPLAHARAMQACGAGEILLTSIDRDGTMSGYDLELTRRVADAVDIPVIACGGAGSVAHLAQAAEQGHASAVAAGAFFLFFGPRRTVLITYPEDDELAEHLPLPRIRDKRLNPTVIPAGTVRSG
ncbi:MAG TPA: AglZ/HisF2 family acetamidino modification protein [Terriglobales bacterium]|nr:AglZ/HisF2 family acetamidino modification protein [Terriglobales bacterium]